MMRRLVLGLLFLIACGGEAATDDPLLLDVTVRDWAPVVTERWAVAGDVRSVAVYGDEVFVGGQGLFGVVTEDGVETLIDMDVAVLLTVGDLGVLVLDEEGALHLWDEGLTPSSLTAALGGPAHDLTLRNDEVWIAGEERVFRWVDGALEHLDLTARRLQGHAKGEGVVADDAWVTPTEGGFKVEDLPGEAWLSAAEQRLLVIDSGTAFERQNAAWIPLSLEGVRGGSVSPSGMAYLVTDQGVLRMEGAEALRVDDPGVPVMAAGDALWWVADGQLHRVGERALDSPPDAPGEPREVGYEADIAPFSLENCERCHAPLKGGRDLRTMDAWVDNIDRAIDQLERGLMPLDGAALVGGDVTLLLQWRDGGLLP